MPKIKSSTFLMSFIAYKNILISIGIDGLLSHLHQFVNNKSREFVKMALGLDKIV
jgi:hypothetical protein